MENTLERLKGSFGEHINKMHNSVEDTNKETNTKIKHIEEREIITTEEDIDKNNPAYFENKENELNNENNENREFYVYKHIRLDNYTCFYRKEKE